MLGAAGAAHAQLEPIPDALKLAPLPGRRTASVGTLSCSPAATPIIDRELRAQKLRDVLNLRRIAENNTSGRVGLEIPQLQTVARLACAHGSDPLARDWLAAYRQVLINQTNMDDAAIDDLLVQSLTQSAARPTGALVCNAFTVDRNAPPHEQYRSKTLQGFVCPADLIGVSDSLYWFDRAGGPERAGEPMPNVMRAGFIRDVLRLDGARETSLNPEIDEPELILLGWIAVRADVAALNPVAARAELARAEISPWHRALALARVFRIKLIADGHAAAWAAYAAANPDFGPLLTSVPQEAFEAFNRAIAADSAGLALAWAHEELFLSQARGRMANCAGPLREAWLSFARRQNPRTIDDVKAVIETPVGYIIGAALYRCERDAGTYGHAVPLGELLMHAPLQRGPRTAAVGAVQKAVAELFAANGRFPVNPNRLGLQEMQPDESWIVGSNQLSNRRSVGEVASLRAQGDRTEITFAQRLVQEPIFRCEETNRISRIAPDGRVEYRQNCVVTGTRPIDVRPEPVSVLTTLVGGARVGSVITAVSAIGETNAFLLDVRPRENAEPSEYMGVRLAGGGGSAAATAAPANAPTTAPAAATGASRRRSR